MLDVVLMGTGGRGPLVGVWGDFGLAPPVVKDCAASSRPSELSPDVEVSVSALPL